MLTILTQLKIQDQLTPPIFVKSGSYGDRWLQAEVDIKTANKFQIGFVGVIGKGARGDIAIDDVALSMGYVFVI